MFFNEAVCKVKHSRKHLPEIKWGLYDIIAHKGDGDIGMIEKVGGIDDRFSYGNIVLLLLTQNIDVTVSCYVYETAGHIVLEFNKIRRIEINYSVDHVAIDVIECKSKNMVLTSTESSIVHVVVDYSCVWLCPRIHSNSDH